MPEIISLENDIHVLKVETPLENFKVENVKNRLESASSPFALSSLSSDNKLFLIISYKMTSGEIVHWLTWIALENFTENYNYLLVTIDEERRQCKCCGPINISLLPPESNAFVFSIREIPVPMDRTTAETQILAGKAKKILRKGSEGTTVVSFRDEDQFCHVRLEEYHEERLRRVPACIMYATVYESLEAVKWRNLEIMPIKEVPSLLVLCQARIKNLWRKGDMSYKKIEEALPTETLILQDFKSEILFEAKLSAHFNFFIKWLESHRKYQTDIVGLPYQTHISDLLSGAFNLERHARAVSVFPYETFAQELIHSFHNLEVFQFDTYNINKLRIAVSSKIYHPPESKLQVLKISSNIVDLNTVKCLLLCCYAANYLENLLKTATTDAEITILQNNLRLLNSEIFIDTSIHVNLIETERNYISIYNLNPKHTTKLTILLWIGDTKAYFVPFSKIVELVKSKELLSKEDLELLVPSEYRQLLKPPQEEPPASTLEM